MRCHLVLLSDQRHGVQQITELYQLSRQRVAHWFTRYEQGGITSLHTAKGRGRRPILRIDNALEVQHIERLAISTRRTFGPL